MNREPLNPQPSILNPSYTTNETPVCFPVEGQRVNGVLHRPVGVTAPFSAVLILHGFTGNKMASFRKFVTLSRQLAAQGIASLRFDYRGCGDSEGEFIDTTIRSEIADARAALAFLRAQEDVDQVGVLGVSLGGLIAVMTLAEEPQVRCACFWAAVSRPSLQLQIRHTPEMEEELDRVGYVEVDGWRVGRAFIEQLSAAAPLETATRIRDRSIFLLHGEKDPAVPPESVDDYERVFKEGGNEVKTHILPEADHRYSRLAWQDEIIGQTVTWFREHLEYCSL